MRGGACVCAVRADSFREGPLLQRAFLDPTGLPVHTFAYTQASIGNDPRKRSKTSSGAPVCGRRHPESPRHGKLGNRLAPQGHLVVVVVMVAVVGIMVGWSATDSSGPSEARDRLTD